MQSALAIYNFDFLDAVDNDPLKTIEDHSLEKKQLAWATTKVGNGGGADYLDEQGQQTAHGIGEPSGRKDKSRTIKVTLSTSSLNGISKVSDPSLNRVGDLDSSS